MHETRLRDEENMTNRLSLPWQRTTSVINGSSALLAWRASHRRNTLHGARSDGLSGYHHQV